MVKQKRKPTVGDVAWEVEWLSCIVRDDNGDMDMDSSEWSCRLLATKEAADVYARKVYPKSLNGSVLITPQRFVPYDEDDAVKYPQVGFWESCGDSEEYSGE